MIPFPLRLLRRWPAALLVALALACGAADDEQGPPLELVLANLEETDVTVALTVTDARVVEEAGVYVTWGIEAEVVEVYKGDVSAGEGIEYRRTIERGTAEPRVGTRYIVSFVREEGELVIPDVGYHFSYSSALDEALTEARQ